MPLTIPRESKSAATIRRRRQKSSTPDMPSSMRHKPPNLDDQWDSGEEDPEVPMEPTLVIVQLDTYYFILSCGLSARSDQKCTPLPSFTIIYNHYLFKKSDIDE